MKKSVKYFRILPCDYWDDHCKEINCLLNIHWATKKYFSRTQLLKRLSLR